MLHFQCTQAANTALTSVRRGTTTSWLDTQAAADPGAWLWQLHATKIARRSVLVAMQAETRFAMMFWGIRKGDGETFMQCFYERLANHLLLLANTFADLNENACHAALERMLDAHRQFSFFPGTDRSVQTHINEAVYTCSLLAEDYGLPPDNQGHAAAFDLHINRTLRSIRGGGYFVPNEEWLCGCLREFAGFDDERLQQVKSRMLAAERKRFA